MSTLTNEPLARAIGLIMRDDEFEVITSSGYHYVVPYTAFPRLASADPAQRSHFEVCAQGRLLHWPLLDEDIAIEHLVMGKYPVKKSVEAKHAAESRPNYGKST